MVVTLTPLLLDSGHRSPLPLTYKDQARHHEKLQELVIEFFTENIDFH